MLAVTGPARLDALPDVPAVAETVPAYVGDSWQGVFVGRGTPQAAVDVLNAALNRILTDGGFRARVRDLGLRPIGGSPDDFRRFLIEDAAAWERVVRDNDIRVE